MFAELIVNIEAPLSGTFHYFVPGDLQDSVVVGLLVEVEFGRRLAQGVIVGVGDHAPVEETKPIIAIIDEVPVVESWQIELARWLSDFYLAPLNSCLRLMLPPGLTRWSDSLYDLNPFWDGSGRLTEAQEQLVELLRERGALRSRQIARAVSGRTAWKEPANQLVRREILRRASILDPPRMKPKQVRYAQLAADFRRQVDLAAELGRSNKEADVLFYLLQSPDPLPGESLLMAATGTDEGHLEKLEEADLIVRSPEVEIAVPLREAGPVPAALAGVYEAVPGPVELIEQDLHELVALGLVRVEVQPATVGLAKSRQETLAEAMKLRAADTYWRVLNFLERAATRTPVSEVYEETGSKMYHLRRLEEAELIQLTSSEVWRDSLADRDFVLASPPPLTDDQRRVWSRLRELERNRKGDRAAARQGQEESGSAAILLHGVTGSGKTEIYLRAIEEALDRGQQAIVLVPEIALTPQTVRRFSARFPGQVALLHSRLSDGERYDTWRRARRGLFDIVVGPRSALFTPFKEVGVIVVDEEHDSSYKQTPPVPPPYYHARDAAVAAGLITGATVILGSATPDVVTYHNARSGRYELLELPKRIMGHRRRVDEQSKRLQIKSQYRPRPDDPGDALEIPLPPVEIVDLRQELRAGNRSIFSRRLAKLIDQTLGRDEQAILFLNRRGTATFVICRDCGQTLKCPRCDMPLTYHRPHLMLTCHHCGYQEPQQQLCPHCGSTRIKFFGLGTEEVEARVRQRWPEARITRWDRDTTAGRDSHEKLLASFINRESDILVGTQMIAKGLDLPFVTLVGVISADVSLGLPDYRTGERAFQILAQVAGRAGRGLLGGQVIVQTYQPEHYAIQAAAEHDFATFYVEEIRFRTRHNLPPFRRLAKLLFVDAVADRGERQAERMATLLRGRVREEAFGATEIIGPVPPFFGRVDRRYRWQVIIRSPDPTRVLEGINIPNNCYLVIDPISTL